MRVACLSRHPVSSNWWKSWLTSWWLMKKRWTWTPELKPCSSFARHSSFVSSPRASSRVGWSTSMACWALMERMGDCEGRQRTHTCWYGVLCSCTGSWNIAPVESTWWTRWWSIMAGPLSETTCAVFGWWDCHAVTTAYAAHPEVTSCKATTQPYRCSAALSD